MFRKTNDEEEFFKALEKGNKQTLAELLESKKVSANCVDKNGTLAIYKTIKFYPRPELAEILLKFGAKINKSDLPVSFQKSSPIITLIEMGKYFYLHGDMNTVDNLYEDFLAYIEVLKKYGAQASKEELQEIETIVSEKNKNHTYIYDKNSFDRQLMNFFANDLVYQPKKIDLENHALIFYRATKNAEESIKRLKFS